MGGAVRISRSQRIQSWRQLSLWPHQIKALTVIERYIRARPARAALIRMPTGTGKSGVIAVAAKSLKEAPSVLVVTPWLHLREQITIDIDYRFWQTIGIASDQWSKEVKEIVPGSIRTFALAGKTPRVLVCTIQTLQTIHRTDPKAYARLREEVSLVLVDEGHREPAPEWAQAVRELKKPTVLLTATPYRNDYRIFDVDPSVSSQE